MRCYVFQKTMKKNNLSDNKNLLHFERVLPKSMRELTFVRLSFFIHKRSKISHANINFLSNLSHTQEIFLKANGTSFSSLGLENSLQEMTKNGFLKKFTLIVDFILEELEGVLEALKECKLTDFCLKAPTRENGLELIAKFLKGMKSLESLNVKISHPTYENSNALNGLCEEINDLKALRSLKLAFNSEKKTALKMTKLTSFLPHLHQIFTKPIPLESLYLSCNQVKFFETVKELSIRLKGLQNSLRKLKVDLGIPSRRNKKNQRLIAELIKPLKNLRKLEIPYLTVNTKIDSNLILTAVHRLKYLEVLKIGEIKHSITRPTFENLIEMILMKRGLRKFQCSIVEGLEEIRSGRKRDVIKMFDVRKIIRANPEIEKAKIYCNPCEIRLTKEIQKWVS